MINAPINEMPHSPPPGISRELEGHLQASLRPMGGALAISAHMNVYYVY